MCTVSYVPTGDHNFILTSNRDENPERITHFPGEKSTIVVSNTIVCPKDSKAGGTWIAMSENGRVACLLNGAFVKHKHEPPYRLSRGLILLDYFSYGSAGEFANMVALNEIENFTLVMVENSRLFELRWDGSQKYFVELDATKPYLWSSCTLYDDSTAEAKYVKFINWISLNPQLHPQAMAHFHGFNNPEGFILDRPLVKTVSITTISKSSSSFEMCYHDLLTNQDVIQQIGIN